MIPPWPWPAHKTKTSTIEGPIPQNMKLTHCPNSIRPQTDSSSQEETNSSDDDQSNDEDTKDNGKNAQSPQYNRKSIQ